MQGSLLVNNLRKIISLIDNLRDLGLEQLIKLPKVVVVGSQSSGKSSLLEQVVGIDFLPRGSGVVTRRPLQLRLTYDPNLKQPFAKFQQIPGQIFTNFNQVRDKIDFLTDRVCGKEKVIINKPIILNISSASCPNITIVDLPGITSIPVGKQPDNIYEITKQMVLSYIKQQRSIILCVIPANQDLSTSQALKITQQIDPKGIRSLGCLTKIDIMDRGTSAHAILLNQQIQLRYGYVGIKNRSQQDINENKPVSKSLQEQKKFFATSPIYSTLPPGCTGTQALTQKITKILYTQIRQSMPKIIQEITTKSNQCKDKLEKLGPGIAKTPQQLIDYVWKIIAKFLKIFKNLLDGMKDSQYPEQPFGPKIRKNLNEFYRQYYEDNATCNLKDSDIKNAIYNFPGESIPGFPSIDAFLALLLPLLMKLKSPAFHLIDQVYGILQKQSLAIIDKVMIKKYPTFNQKYYDVILKVFEESRQEAKNSVQQILDSQIQYLYTNDNSYLLAEFKVNQKSAAQKKKNFDPLVFQLRKRIDAYYNLIVRNLRDIIPKQISYFLLYKGLKQLQFESYNFIASYQKLQKWFQQPKEIKEQREKMQKALETLQSALKRIRRDPEFGKMIRLNKTQQKYYQKLGLEYPNEKEETPQKYITRPKKKSPPKDQKNSKNVKEQKALQTKKSDQDFQFPKMNQDTKNNPDSSQNIKANEIKKNDIFGTFQINKTGNIKNNQINQFNQFELNTNNINPQINNVPKSNQYQNNLNNPNLINPNQKNQINFELLGTKNDNKNPPFNPILTANNTSGNIGGLTPRQPTTKPPQNKQQKKNILTNLFGDIKKK